MGDLAGMNTARQDAVWARGMFLGFAESIAVMLAEEENPEEIRPQLYLKMATAHSEIARWMRDHRRKDADQ